MSGKTYLLIGLFGALICPILDFFYDRNLILESNNLWVYIGVQIALMFINGSLQLAVFAFFDNARVDWKRRSYLMQILSSTIQACDSLKFKAPEMIITPLFNFLD